MNPIGVILLGLGVLFLVVGFRGHQDNLISAMLGHQWGSSTLDAVAPAPAPAPAPGPVTT